MKKKPATKRPAIKQPEKRKRTTVAEIRRILDYEREWHGSEITRYEQHVANLKELVALKTIDVTEALKRFELAKERLNDVNIENQQLRELVAKLRANEELAEARKATRDELVDDLSLALDDARELILSLEPGALDDDGQTLALRVLREHYALIERS